MKIKAKILNDVDVHRTIVRLAHQIVEKNKGAENICIVGMRTRGEFLARRIANEIVKLENIELKVGILDATLYRDDFRKKLRTPKVQLTNIPFDITERHIILIDDVLYTGRTVRAALDELMDFGRPASIQLTVLIDRGHRELPIKADFVGKEIITSINEEVRVRFTEIDEADEVLLVEIDENELNK
jgi:pyrimidine operon attenuation protein / uracil phosphoribosyltransferase